MFAWNIRFLRKKQWGGVLIHLDNCLSNPLCGNSSGDWQDHRLWVPHLWRSATLFRGSFGIQFVLAYAQPSTISEFTEYWFICWNIPSPSIHVLTSFLFPSELTYILWRFLAHGWSMSNRRVKLHWTLLIGALFPSPFLLPSFFSLISPLCSPLASYSQTSSVVSKWGFQRLRDSLPLGQRPSRAHFSSG